MITGQLWELTDDPSLQRIADTAFALLTKHGAQVHHDGALDLLEGAGCRVDRLARHAWFTEDLLHRALAQFGSAPPEGVSIPHGWSPAHNTGTGNSYPHFLDWPSCIRRQATVEDVIAVAKMAQMLPEFTTVGKAFTCCEIDQRIEPIWSAVTLMGLTDKPLGSGEVLYAQNVKHLVRLSEIASGQPGDTRLVASCDFCISPLTYGQRMLECMIEKSRFGIDHVPGSMVISGMTGPVTVPGTAALALAELIGAFAIYYCIEPDRFAGAGVATGSLDMRTTRASFGSPEAILQDLTVVQALRRLYGVPAWAAYNYVDCKTPGFQATFEKMLPLLTMPFEGQPAFGASGLLSAGQDYSPVQHLLELDMLGAVDRFMGTYEVTDDSLALEALEEVLSGEVESFIDTDHTAWYFRTEQWNPRWLDRRMWQSDAVERGRERAILTEIDAYWKDAVRRYERPEIDRERLTEAQAVLRAAEAEMPSLHAQV